MSGNAANNIEVVDLWREKTSELEKYLVEYFDRLVDKCKIWISSPNEHSDLALRVLAQILSDENLKRLYDELSNEERLYSKELISDEVTGKLFFDSLEFIRQEIKKEVMSPSICLDPHFFNLINSLKSKHLEYLYENHQNLLPSILQFVPEYSVIQFLNKSGNEQVFQVLSDCLSEERALDQKKIDELTPILSEMLNRSKLSLLNKRILSSLGDLSESKLMMACEKLVEQGYLNEVVDSLSENPPLQIVSRIPQEQLKSILADIQEKTFFKFIVTRNEKEHFLNAYAEAGSKKREMIDMELSQVTEEDIKGFKLQNETIEKDFLVQFRVKLKKLGNSSQLSSIVKDWVSEVKGVEK